MFKYSDMFEKIRSGETARKVSDTFYWAAGILHLVDVEKAEIAPEPYYAIIEGEPWKFSHDDTHVARCVENPGFSAIVHTFKDERERDTGVSVYDQPDIMDDLEAQGFEVIHEELAEARDHYHLFHARGNDQAQLN